MQKLTTVFACLLVMSYAANAQNAKGMGAYADYYGKYKFDPGSPLEEASILWKDSTVQISTAMGDATMTWLGTDSFSMSYENGTILFKRAGNTVNKIVIIVSGTTLEGKKDIPNLKDSTMYADYYGKYKFDAGSPIDEATIMWKDSTVQISTSMGDATMDLLGTDSFHMSYQDGIIVFKRGGDSKVNKIVITVSGTELDGKKEAVAAGGTIIRRKEMRKEEEAVAR